MTRMRYTTELTDMKYGFKLWIPIAEHVKAVFKSDSSSGENMQFPYWSRIWPAAFVLTDFLLEEIQWVKDKNVLELGAGIGLPSFAIADMAKQVIISDSIDEATQLISKNIETLHLKNAHSVKIDWRSLQNPLSADTLIMSDICYDPDQFKLIFDLITIYKMLGTDIIIVAPHRLSTKPFLALIQPLIKRSVLKTHDGIENMITIL